MATENQKAQSARFDQAIADMIAAGELNPTDADAAFERLMDRVKVEKTEGASRDTDSP